MNNKAIYYRNEELVTPEQKERILKLWGTNRGYNFFNEYEFNTGYNTGLETVVNIISTIENTERLNNKDVAFRERISKTKKLTKSSGRGYDYVEQNLLSEFIKEVANIFNKDADAEYRVSPTIIGHTMYEYFRIYGLPFSSVMNKIEKEETIVKNISEPKQRYDVTPAFGKLEPEYSQNSSFKEYHVKLDRLGKSIEGNKAYSNTLYKKYPFLSKLYFSTLYDEKYWQIYVHDYFDRDWALQTILHEMHSK